MKELKECLVCGNTNLKVYCDMGQMPLVNNLKNSPEEKDLIFPLLVNECPVCTHKQLSISADRELMFSDYLYQTGTSQRHKEFFIECANLICWGKPTDSNILDIGCNDGSFLEIVRELYGWDILGVDPSVRLAEKYIIKDYFPFSVPFGGRFSCITAFNVFAHNDDPKTFLIEMANLLKEDGRIYILTTPARLDNFYHEHISYFTPQSMMVLAQRCGVEVVSFKTVSMHGESYLFEIKNNTDNMIRSMHPLQIIMECKNIVAYGASASETVLFNHFKIVPEYVVDDNPLKQGKFIPGINSPIVSPDHLSRDSRDLTIIVAHHLFNEISAKIKKLRPGKNDVFVNLMDNTQ